MKRLSFQIMVVGSGFAGSLMAMIAARLGFNTALVERGKHPRFVIGESTTPLTNLLLGEIARDYRLDFLQPFCKWGPWQQVHPQIPCGIKRGFTFYQHSLDHSFAPDPQRQRQLLVGASPDESVADTHWYRPEFDQYLVQRAQELEVAYFDQTELTTVEHTSNGVRLLGNREQESFEFTAELLIDASGPRGFLHHVLNLGEHPFPSLPPTQALFTHFINVGALPEEFGTQHPALPYPAEHAAVHHVFDGGWIWVLKFNNGITSAGVAATDPLAQRLNLAEGEPAWRRLLDLLPSLAKVFSPARATLPFVYQRRLAYQCQSIAGPNWVLLPSAAGVVDPLLSTGFPLTLLGIKRLAELLRNDWQKPTLQASLREYATKTSQELNATANLVSALYRTMGHFSLFKQLSLLYFAAASFSENARRLGKPHLVSGFLLSNNSNFSARLTSFCSRVQQPLSPVEADSLRREIRETIEPFDVIGLTDESRDPWYPALTSDLVLTAPKLGVTSEEVAKSLGGV